MKYKKIGICCILFLLASLYSIQLLDEAKLQYGSVSLRYHDGVSKQQVEQVKQYLSMETLKETTQEMSEIKIFPTFWKEQDGIFESEFKKAETLMLVYLGEGYQVYSVEFLSGGYPVEGDTKSCAISDSLAFELYGSKDVIGLVLEHQEDKYTIRGVFKDEVKIGMFVGEEDENYTVVELVGDMKGDSEGTVTIFVGNSGLEAPDQIVYGIGIASLLELACNLPLLIVVIWLSLNSISLIQNRYPEIKEILWIFVFLLFAYNLPSLLEQIPQWILPSRWSDFTFWQSLLETMIMRIEEWFFLQVTIKDVIIKFIILKVGLLVAVQLICTYYLYSAFQPNNVKID